MFAAFSVERLGNATMSLAIAQAALDKTLAYTHAASSSANNLSSSRLYSSRWRIWSCKLRQLDSSFSEPHPPLLAAVYPTHCRPRLRSARPTRQPKGH